MREAEWKRDHFSRVELGDVSCQFRTISKTHVMKLPKILFFLCAGTMMAGANPTPAQQAEVLYRKGIAAENAGDPAAAEKAYKQALEVNPHHANARYRQGQLKMNAGAIAARGREAKIGAVTIPTIQLDGATLQEALDYIQLVIERESKGEVTPNFIVQDPAGKLKDRSISLQLKGLPAKAVLKYVLTQTGAKARYDEHAVVIVPR